MGNMTHAVRKEHQPIAVSTHLKKAQRNAHIKRCHQTYMNLFKSAEKLNISYLAEVGLVSVQTSIVTVTPQ